LNIFIFQIGKNDDDDVDDNYDDDSDHDDHDDVDDDDEVIMMSITQTISLLTTHLILTHLCLCFSHHSVSW
jgi:hypothetical protein